MWTTVNRGYLGHVNNTQHMWVTTTAHTSRRSEFYPIEFCHTLTTAVNRGHLGHVNNSQQCIMVILDKATTLNHGRLGHNDNSQSWTLRACKQQPITGNCEHLRQVNSCDSSTFSTYEQWQTMRIYGMWRMVNYVNNNESGTFRICEQQWVVGMWTTANHADLRHMRIRTLNRVTNSTRRLFRTCEQQWIVVI